MEAGQLRVEAAAGLDAVRRGFSPTHMLALASQVLFDQQFNQL